LKGVPKTINWKSEREYWAVWLNSEERFLMDRHDAPIAFESVEEAKTYIKQKRVVLEDSELATTPTEAKRGGIKATISPIRVMTRSI
jgi:hypothetical protein